MSLSNRWPPEQDGEPEKPRRSGLNAAVANRKPDVPPVLLDRLRDVVRRDPKAAPEARLALAVYLGEGDVKGHRAMATASGLSRAVVAKVAPSTRGEISEYGLLVCARSGIPGLGEDRRPVILSLAEPRRVPPQDVDFFPQASGAETIHRGLSLEGEDLSSNSLSTGFPGQEIPIETHTGTYGSNLLRTDDQPQPAPGEQRYPLHSDGHHILDPALDIWAKGTDFYRLGPHGWVLALLTSDRGLTRTPATFGQVQAMLGVTRSQLNRLIRTTLNQVLKREGESLTIDFWYLGYAFHGGDDYFTRSDQANAKARTFLAEGEQFAELAEDPAEVYSSRRMARTLLSDDHRAWAEDIGATQYLLLLDEWRANPESLREHLARSRRPTPGHWTATAPGRTEP